MILPYIYVSGKFELRKDGDYTFKCPFCYDSYKKNGMPRKNAKNIHHILDMSKCKVLVDETSANKFSIVPNVIPCDPGRFPVSAYSQFRISF